jgi:hypothetical protein
LETHPTLPPTEIERRTYHKLVIALRYRWYCLLPITFLKFWNETLKNADHVDYVAPLFSLEGGIEIVHINAQQPARHKGKF